MDTKRITLTKSDLDAMSAEDVNNLLLRAQRVEATCVVRRQDGSIKYDRPELAGTYGEEHLNNG